MVQGLPQGGAHQSMWTGRPGLGSGGGCGEQGRSKSVEILMSKVGCEARKIGMILCVCAIVKLVLHALWVSQF